MATLRSDEVFSFQDGQGQRSAALPADLVVLVTDSLASPATFVVKDFVLRSLRDARHTLLVGLQHGQEHYAAIMKKSGVQLNAERDKGQFCFVQGTDDSFRLKTIDALFRDVHSSLAQGSLCIIDDVSTLLWAGVSLQDILRFVSSLRTAVSNKGGTLVLLQHGDELPTPEVAPEETYLFRRLYSQSDIWIQTTSLSSQTRGELQVHRGGALVRDIGLVTRSGPTAIQYKVEEAGAVYHIKGLGRAFF